MALLTLPAGIREFLDQDKKMLVGGAWVSAPSGDTFDVLDPATGQLVPGDIRAQTERVLQNILLILQDQGLGMAQVVKSTVFMTNLADFAAMNETYARHFQNDPPARSTVQVRPCRAARDDPAAASGSPVR